MAGESLLTNGRSTADGLAPCAIDALEAGEVDRAVNPVLWALSSPGVVMDLGPAVAGSQLPGAPGPRRSTESVAAGITRSGIGLVEFGVQCEGLVVLMLKPGIWNDPGDQGS